MIKIKQKLPTVLMLVAAVALLAIISFALAQLLGFNIPSDPVVQTPTACGFGDEVGKSASMGFLSNQIARNHAKGSTLEKNPPEASTTRRITTHWDF